MKLFGVDFTSAPTRRKPIVVACGSLHGGDQRASLRIEALQRLETFADFERWLHAAGPWLAGFDFPFGLPRELVLELGWPHQPGRHATAWARLVRKVAAQSRAELVEQFKAFCDARPAGGKFAHRAADRPAGSSPSMKWVNPPVAFMLHAGAPRLLAAGVTVPGLQPGDPQRIALEAYPGWLARAVVGRHSYKSDQPGKQTAERLAQRERIVAALEHGRHPLGLAAAFEPAVRKQCCADGSGDCLDAALCLVQAAWGWQRRSTGYGLPASIDPIEGWIVGVVHDDLPQ